MPPHQAPGRQNLLRRVCTTVAVAMAVVLLCLLLWYGIYAFLLVFASVLLAIFLYSVSYWVSTHTPLSYGWALTLVALACIAIIGGSLWWTGAALGEQVDELIIRLPRALQKLQQRLEQYEWARNLLAELPEAGAVALPPALTILSQVLLGVLAGGMGLALATPLAAASLVLVQRFYVEDTLGDSLEVPSSRVSPDRAPG